MSIQRRGAPEAIEFLARNGSFAVWYADEQRFRHLGSPGGANRSATGKEINRVVIRYWSAIDALLQGKCCNVCGDELAEHEQTGEPICLSCFLDGHVERPEYVRRFARDSSQVKL